jgi:predicted dehydrogenase
MKIGILSFAHHHGEAYIQNLRRIPQVELLGVADEDTQRGRHFAQLHEAPVYQTYEDLISAKPDGVIICSENNKHRPLVELAAAAGVSVLCEKPLATTLVDASAIVQVCERAGVLLMTAFPMRFSAPLLEVKSRLHAGDFGEVYCFNATNQGESPRKYREWFVDKTLAGGGAIMDHTVHLVDIMRWYLGQEVVKVYAQTNQIFHAGEFEVETGGLELLTFADQTFATIDASWCRPDYWPTWGGLTFEMVTERGAILVDAFRQNLNIYRHEWERAGWAYWGSDSNQAMIEEFIAALSEGRQPRVTGKDGYRAVQVALAAYQSVSSGQPVSLETD